MTTPVSLPLKAQIGLICMSAKKPTRFLDSCMEAARGLLEDMEVNAVDVSLSESIPLKASIPPPKER